MEQEKRSRVHKSPSAVQLVGTWAACARGGGSGSVDPRAAAGGGGRQSALPIVGGAERRPIRPGNPLPPRTTMGHASRKAAAAARALEQCIAGVVAGQQASRGWEPLHGSSSGRG